MINKKNIVWASIIIVAVTGFFFVKNVLFAKTEVLYDATQDEIVAEDIDVEEIEQETKEDTPKEVTVFISGEVQNQQVVTLPNGKRLDDAVKLCGGVTPDADLNQVNLAQKLEDQGHYVVPKIGEEPIVQGQNNPAVTSKNTQSDETGLININTASKEQLITLPGIGDKMADRIIEYRENQQPFPDIESIQKVNGIGEKKYQELKDKITV